MDIDLSPPAGDGDNGSGSEPARNIRQSSRNIPPIIITRAQSPAPGDVQLDTLTLKDAPIFVTIGDVKATQYGIPNGAWIPQPLTKEMLESCPKMGTYSHVYRVSKEVVAKCGPKVRLAEAIVMKQLEQWGQPVPQVLDFYYEAKTGHALILMRHVEGVSLETAWSIMKRSERNYVLLQLRAIIERLRTYQGQRIANVDGGNVTDELFEDTHGGGPCPPSSYDTHAEFVDALHDIVATRAAGSDDSWTDLVSSLVLTFSQNGPLPLTHGDINPHNIMVQGKPPRIVAILDWSQAGYYPDYWEFCKACWKPDFSYFRLEDVAKILEPHYRELSIMCLIRKMVW